MPGMSELRRLGIDAERYNWLMDLVINDQRRHEVGCKCYLLEPGSECASDGKEQEDRCVGLKIVVRCVVSKSCDRCDGFS